MATFLPALLLVLETGGAGAIEAPPRPRSGDRRRTLSSFTRSPCLSRSWVPLPFCLSLLRLRDRLSLSLLRERLSLLRERLSLLRERLGIGLDTGGCNCCVSILNISAGIVSRELGKADWNALLGNEGDGVGSDDDEIGNETADEVGGDGDEKVGSEGDGAGTEIGGACSSTGACSWLCSASASAASFSAMNART